MKRGFNEPEAMSRLTTAATGLACIAICIAALASMMDKSLEAIGVLHVNLNSNLAAGAPGDKLWTSLLCLSSLAAGACVAVERAISKHDKQPRYSAMPSEQVTVGALVALAGVSLASLATRWLAVNHGSDQYLDAMLRGVAYWTALVSLSLCALQLGRRSAKAFRAISVTLIAASTVAAAVGVQDYLINVIAKHIVGWREFGTSTPDFYAAFLLITLPICFAAFLASSKRDSSLVYGFCTALQLAALPTTGSRFALISLAAELLIFGAGCLAWKRGGGRMPPEARTKLLSVAIIVVIGAVLFAGPVLHRLQASSLRGDSNSGAFRIYTWRGAISLYKAYPVLGAGPNLFQYEFPKRAVAGFTRLAHSGYLQLLDELGPLGLAAIVLVGAGSASVAGKVLLGSSAVQSKTGVAEGAGENASEPLALIGAASGALGLCVQNIIDSDWMVTICGATWFAAIGVLLAAASRMRSQDEPESADAVESDSAKRRRAAICWSAALCALFLGACCLKWSVGGWQERQGDTGLAYATAPLDGDYAGAAALALERDPSQSAAALADLLSATKLTPSPTAFRRLAELHLALGDWQASLSDIQSGLSYDPHDLALLLMAAQLSGDQNRSSDALHYYGKMAQLQQSPYGTTPALTGVVEYRYAYADQALASEALRIGKALTSISYALRAKAVLDEYLSEGGSTSLMRQAMIGSSSASNLDVRLQRLYAQVMTTLANAYRASGQPGKADAIGAECAKTAPLFIHKPAPASTRPAD